MKKIFFAALAAVALTACVADVVTEEPTYAIDFVSSAQGTVKTTVVTSENLPSFQVFAFNNETAEKTNTIMNNMTVTKAGDAWTYSPKKYWPVLGDVDFYGIYVDGLDAKTQSSDYVTYVANASEGLSFTIDMNPETKWVTPLGEVNAANVPDVVYATAIGKEKGQGNPAVEMNFRHAMAQIDFQIKNATTADDKITVESGDVSVDGLAVEGTYTTPKSSTSIDNKTITGSWSNLGTALYAYLFESAGVSISATETKGILSSNEDAKCMALPQATAEGQQVRFQVNCKIRQNGVLIFDGIKTARTSIDWKEGHKYTYTFVFDANSIKDNEIKFTATVAPIEDGTTPDGTPAN